ncbi:uncharacterized protein Gasu_34400 [Galdieria sulphuraria]|uniref:Uncharacterized protein n=1 Tax=Galdieria sulphuraria TaxID=130081 RepID=M2XZP0_GALSU|nr:uncharacterized protein Gasu_34400 [Galdieria sulphuraria]EME29044.1 hypothetical protein Gasu_34400 [Galdieria sulphuraria]|eukprot:XP_005705564.1 hypothetical protein Gasu_34400 [Galdieria sulphuraria]
MFLLEQSIDIYNFYYLFGVYILYATLVFISLLVLYGNLRLALSRREQRQRNSSCVFGLIFPRYSARTRNQSDSQLSVLVSSQNYIPYSSFFCLLYDSFQDGEIDQFSIDSNMENDTHKV